jgi:opacity protein-like surface antigen
MKTQSKMGRIILVVAAVGLVSAWSLRADDTVKSLAADNTGKWYVGGDVGATFQQNLGGIKHNGVPESGDIEFDPGVRVDLNVGYNLNQSFAVELEGGFSYNGVSKTGDTKRTDSYLCQVPLLVNGIYKYSFNDKWQAYGGVGIGGVASTLNLKDSSGSSSSDTDYQFGYQAMLGVKYLINANWECDLGYKLLGTLDHDWTFQGAKIETDPTFSHSVLLSLTYKF